MGNEASKSAQEAPETEIAAMCRVMSANIKEASRRYDERELAAQQRRAREDAEWAAAATREQALAEQARLVEKQRAAHIAAGVDTNKSVEDAAVTTAPGTPDVSDVLAGWNPRKEPRPKSSSGKSREQNQSQTQAQKSGSDPSDGVSMNQQVPTRQTANPKEPPKWKGKTSSLPSAPSVTTARLQEAQQAAPNPAKRAEPASGFEESGRRESRLSFSLQKHPRVEYDIAPFPSPDSPASDEDGRQQPDWYRKMSAVAKRDSTTGNADALLDRLKGQIAVLKKKGPGNIKTKDLNELRESLHEAPFLAMGAAGPQLLRKKRMLHNDDGLPQLFDDRYAGSMKGHWPWDIKSDAAELYHKWCSRNFDDDMLFGLILAQKSSGKNVAEDRKGDTVDKKFQVSSKYKGNGKLVNGQWWPTLLCALRDGAHGDSQAGISGDTGIGAYSCFMSGGEKHQYPDKDEGDVVHYYGQDTTTPGQLSRGTALLKKNKIDGIPVRFIRSSKAKSHSKYAPQIGFRYDGLYDVVSYELKDKAKERYCFKLVRQSGQGPIRGGGGPEARPTQQEQERFKQDKRFRGFGSKD